MATNEPGKEVQRAILSPEESVGASFIRLDWRAGWFGLVLGGIFSLLVLAYFGHPIIGVVDLFLAITAFVLAVVPLFNGLSKSLATVLFEGGTKIYDRTTGATIFKSNQPQQGEYLGEVPLDKRGRKDLQKAYSALIGLIRFIPYTGEEVQSNKDQVGTVPAPENTTAALGIADDRRYGTLSATMLVKGSSTVNLDPDVGDEHLRMFSSSLDLVADPDSLIDRIAFRVQTVMGEPQDPQALQKQIQTAANLSTAPIHGEEQLYRHLTDQGYESVQHRTTMTLTLRKKAAKKAAKQLGSEAAVLEQQIGQFYDAAMGDEDSPSPFGWRFATVLSYNELVLENRRALDPVWAQPFYESWRAPTDPSVLINEDLAWAKFIDFSHDDYCKIGQTYHAGYFMTFNVKGILPLEYWNLLKLRIPKTITTIIQMVPAHQAQRRAEWATNARTGHANERLEKGRRVTEASLVSTGKALTHEREIANSMGETGRVRVYIDLTASTLDELQVLERKLAKAGYSSRTALEPLTGRQSEGIEAALMVGRGLTAIDIYSKL